MLIWAPGTVKRIADGLQDKRSSRARTVLPAGAVLWAWEDDPEFGEKAGEQWLFLLPSKFNKQSINSWRLDVCELECDRSVERPRNVRRATRNSE